MLKLVFKLLSHKDRCMAGWVALSVLARSILDFFGIAALIPVLIMVLGKDSNPTKALQLCVAVFVFVLLKNALVMRLARFQNHFLLDIYKLFSRQMFCNYYNRGFLFLKGKSSVQLAHEVNFICYTFSLCVLSPLFKIVGEALLLLMMIAALIIWAPLSGILLCVGFLPIVILYVRIVKKRLRSYGTEELEARRNQSRTVVEAFRGYPELEISEAFQSLLTSFDLGLNVIAKNRLRMEITQLFPSFLSEISIIIGLALLIGLSGGDLGVMSGVFAIAAYRMIPSVRGILNSWSTLQNASHSITTIAEGLEKQEERTMNQESDFQFKHAIKIKNLTFIFPDGGVILKNLNFNIARGEKVGIRGSSGSGKSTLFNLLLGFLQPTFGEIWIDERTLTSVNRRQWHKLVGYVPQEIFIIQGSLAENIALGQKEIDRNKIMRVLSQVKLKEWAEMLPQGINTYLGEYGSRLSGGQKQRIGIARALYKDAEVLFFDEATSALDNETEHEINLALEELSVRYKELTMIVIAHRESSLTFCDRIIEL